MNNEDLTPFDEKMFQSSWGIDWQQIAHFNANVPNDAQKRLIDIIESLPHGSGIDSDWSMHETKSYYCFTNSYHAMDENGYYDGWADFTVKIPKDTINDPDRLSSEFVLQFNGVYAQYLNRKHYLRDYLEDTIHESLWQTDHEYYTEDGRYKMRLKEIANG